VSALPARVVSGGLQPGELLAHLEAQIESSRRLLQALIGQTDAIRDHQVEQVLTRLREIQVEVAGRARLELERGALLERAGAALGLAPEVVDLKAMLPLLPIEEREPALALSAELKGLAKEIERVHAHNRILIRQELAFVDHLLRAMSGTPQGGYTADGAAGTPAPVQMATLDFRA
jgi:hypothetical protein